MALMVGAQACESSTPRIGDRAPSIDAAGIVDGQRVRTPDHAQGYLVNFWGSWCEPCQRELPRLATANASGTAIVGVAVKSSSRLARELLASSGAHWSSASDPDGAIAARWGVSSGFPVTVAVDHAGIIRDIHIGELKDEDVAHLAALTR